MAGNGAVSGAPTWVLLRGLARESGHWGEFPQRLRQQLGPGHRVLAPDLPGNGRAWAARSPSSVAAMVQACRRELAYVLAEGPVRLVALSLGGMVAIEWARTAPAELAGCALDNTSLRGISPPWDRRRPAHWPTVLRLLRPGAPPQARERAVLPVTSADPSRHPAPVANWVALADAHPVAPANVMRQFWAAARFRAPQQPPPVPMLVLYAAGDRLVSPRCSRELARRWHLPLREHPWAGHDLPLDDPDWLAIQLVAWAGGAAA